MSQRLDQAPPQPEAPWPPEAPSPPEADPALDFGVDSTLVVADELQPHDRVPGFLRRLRSAWFAALPVSGRNRVAGLLALMGLAAAGIFLSARLLRLLLDITDIGAYLGLFIVNWVANGGLLVPIPGLRIIGWLLIVSQGAALDPAVAGVVGGIAMALGQTSYYVAGDASRDRAPGRTSDEPGPPRHERLARLTSGARVTHARQRITALIRVHGFATVAVLSLVPSPLTAFACATAGAMGMGFRRFVVASLLGRIALGLLLAYLGSGLGQWLDLGSRF